MDDPITAGYKKEWRDFTNHFSTLDGFVQFVKDELQRWEEKTEEEKNSSRELYAEKMKTMLSVVAHIFETAQPGERSDHIFLGHQMVEAMARCEQEQKEKTPPVATKTPEGTDDEFEQADD